MSFTRNVCVIAISFCLAAQAATKVPRGIYVYSWEVALRDDPPPAGCASNCTAAQQLMNAVATNGVDGLTLVLDWSAVATAPGPAANNFQWQRMDKWIAATEALKKHVLLAIRGGGGSTGNATPCWMFQDSCGSGYSGQYVNAAPFTVDAAAHQGASFTHCILETIAAPWDAHFIVQWEDLLTNLAGHLQSTTLPDGTTEWDAVPIIRLTGVNRTTDETRLPEQTPATLGSCTNPINAIQQWLYPPPNSVGPYRPAALFGAWTLLVDAYQRSFPGKYINIAIIPNDIGSGQGTGVSQNPFPEIDDNGCVYDPPVDPTQLSPVPCTNPNFATVDQNEPLLQYASQTFSKRLSIEFEEINAQNPANPYVVQQVQSLNSGHTHAAFMTNNWLTDGAACSGSPGNASPCPDGPAYFNLIERGIYLPTPQSSPRFRSEFLEVFYTDVLRGPDFPCAIWQGHIDLTDYTPPDTKDIITGSIWRDGGYGPVTVKFKATDASTSGQPQGCAPLTLTTEYKVNDGSWTVGDSVSLSDLGAYTVRFRSTDVAGNQEAVKSIDLIINRTGP